MSLKLLITSCVLTALSILSLFLLLEWPDKYVHIIACDVGQGDGILVTHGFTQVLIDAGPDGKVLDCLRHYMPFWDKNIEVVVATHAHQDHIGGMPSVFRQFQIGSLMLTGQTNRSDDFKQFRASVRELREKGTVLSTPRLGKQIIVNQNVRFYVIWPEKDDMLEKTFLYDLTETELSAYFEEKVAQEDRANDGSIALLLEYGEFSFLSMADVELASEQTLLAHHLIKDIDVLKAGHHGSKTSSSAPFLADIRPELTIISCGQDNDYGHPHSEVLHRLEMIGTRILRTDQLGHIELRTDGHHLWYTHHFDR